MNAASPAALNRLCASYVEDAIEAAGGRAVVYCVEDRDTVRALFVTPGAAEMGRAAQLESAALDATRAGRAVGAEWSPDGGVSGVVALPAFLDEELVAVIVVVAPTEAITGCTDRLAPSLLPIALTVDRQRTHGALVQRGKEISALRQQLGAYAVDFRSTYRAERDRSAQLAAALSELEETYLATVQGLAIAVEAKDECTGGHLQRVSRYGMMLTKLVADDHADDVQFEYGFLLHDIGKLTVPDVVLLKPGALSDDEWTLMREHPTAGRSILSGIPFLAGAREIVFAHHERWDGRGYPRRLRGDEIPLGAQIFPICDAFDAMTSDRPYRPALATERALAELRKGSGAQFRPDAVEAFLALPIDELNDVRASEMGRAYP